MPICNKEYSIKMHTALLSSVMLYHQLVVDSYDTFVHMMQTCFIGTGAVVSWKYKYHQTSYTSRTLAGNNIVDPSDVVGASPVGADPSTSSFSPWHLASMDWAQATARRDKKHDSFMIWCKLQYIPRNMHTVLLCFALLWIYNHS